MWELELGSNFSIGHGHHVVNSEILTSDRIWLLDLAKSLPSAQFDGFDISESAFPPEQWLPDNLSLRVLNAFDEPPAELWGRYDVVHLRLFLLVVNDNDPTQLLNHCIKLLSEYWIALSSGAEKHLIHLLRTRGVSSMGGI